MTFGIAFKDLTNSHSYLQFTIVCVCVCMLSHVLFFCNPMEPTRFLYSWGSPGKTSGVVAISFSGDLPDPEIEVVSLASPILAGRFFTNCTTWEALTIIYRHLQITFSYLSLKTALRSQRSLDGWSFEMVISPKSNRCHWSDVSKGMAWRK